MKQKFKNQVYGDFRNIIIRLSLWVMTDVWLMQVKSFKTKEEVDKWLYKHPLAAPGALHFKERNNSVISYGIQTSPTPSDITKAMMRYEDPTFKYLIPFQINAEREIARSLIGGTLLYF